MPEIYGKVDFDKEMVPRCLHVAVPVMNPVYTYLCLL